MITRGYTGPDVAGVQRKLLELGFKMPLTIRSGRPDGACGNEMLTAFSLFMDRYGAEADADRETIDDGELQLLDDVYAKALVQPLEVFDVMHEAANVPYGERAETDITGICLHHTASLLGERPQRWRTVVAHLGITRGGKRIRIHRPTKVIGHGGCNNPPSNGWNRRCVGVEVDGRLYGIFGNQKTVWNDPDTPGIEIGDVLTVWQRRQLRDTVAELVERYPSIKFLVSHRQSSWSRQADPGQEVWEVALDLMQEFGLSDGGPGFAIDSGRPNPREWDPSRTGQGYFDPPRMTKG